MCGCKTGDPFNVDECPNCKKKIRSIGGVKQKVCPFCKTPLISRESNGSSLN